MRPQRGTRKLFESAIGIRRGALSLSEVGQGPMAGGPIVHPRRIADIRIGERTYHGF